MELRSLLTFLHTETGEAEAGPQAPEEIVLGFVLLLLDGRRTGDERRLRQPGLAVVVVAQLHRLPVVGVQVGREDVLGSPVTVTAP